MNSPSERRMTIAVIAGFACSAVASVLVIWWAYQQWGWLGGLGALLIAPETVGYLVYMAVAMALSTLLAALPSRSEKESDGPAQPQPAQQVTIAVHGVGPVTFTRRPDGQVVFDLPAGSHVIAPGVVVREGFLELTKQQLTAGMPDPWFPDLVEQARRELDVEAVTSDEQGREVRRVVSGERIVTFARADDGTVTAGPSEGPSGESVGHALSVYLAEENAPLALTRLQLRRGEPVWFPDLEHQAAAALHAGGFDTPELT